MAGRQQELAQLNQFLVQARKGKGSTVLISGEAGCGKTRLANEFLKVAKSEATVLSGWCLSNSAIPYFPFIEAFDSHSASNETQVEANEDQNLKLKSWLTMQSSGGEEAGLSRQTWRDQAFASVTRELLLLSTQKPVVVFIDDIHWADSASLALLQYLAKAIVCERILLLATFRSEEIEAHLDSQSQALSEILRILRRENLYQEIKIAGLSLVEVGQIAKSMLTGNVSRKLIERLTAETLGNPLFVIESIRMLAEQRGLIQENNCWTVVDDDFGVPDKVMDVILRRLGALNLEARQVLDAGAVIGDKFDAELIGAVLEQSTVKVLGILNSISKSKSLVCCEQDWFRFDHPKTREALYQEISLPLRREYHLRVAVALEAKRPNQVADLAYHFVNSGNNQKAVKYSLDAGKNALARFGNIEAIQHFNYVLKTLEDSRNTAERAVALEGLGDAYYANMSFSEAIKTFKTLAVMDGSTKVRALRKAMECAFFQNASAELKALLKEVEKCEISDRLEKARILMNKARATSKGGNLQEAVGYFEEGLNLAEEEYSPWDVAWILIGLGSTQVWTSHRLEALARLLRAVAIFRELGDNRWLIEAYNAAGHTLIAHFDLRKEGIDFLKKAAQVENEAKVGDYLRLAQLNASWARALAIEGDVHGALSKSLEALANADKTDSGWAKGVVYANLTIFYSALENAGKAEEYFARLMKMPPEVLSNSYVGAPTAKGCYLALTKQWTQANLIFDAIIKDLHSLPAPGVEVSARMIYSTILDRQGQTESARQQRQAARTIKNSINKELEEANIYASVMMPVRLSTDQTFEMRIDLVNVSKGNARIVAIRNILPPESEIKPVSPNVIAKDNIVELDDVTLEPLSVRSIKLAAQVPKLGSYTLSPQLSYLDREGQARNASLGTVKIHVGSAPFQVAVQGDARSQAPIFKSEAAERIFDFLLKAFRHDYTHGKMPLERSGWRSLMEIVRGAEVSRYSVYAFPRNQGQPVAQLQHAGLVEVRVFEGERGRGGQITKVRVCYEKESVKTCINK